MIVTIKVEGEIVTRRETIQCVLDVPEDWKPNWNEFSKVKGALRYLEEKFSQTFTPPASNN